VSQVEAAVYSLTPWVLDYDVNGHIGVRQGNRSDRFVPHGAFSCTGNDRFVAVACWDDDDWRRLADALGIDPELSNALGTLSARRQRVDDVEAMVEAWTSRQDATSVAAQLQAIGVEAVPVADLGDASTDEQLLHRGHFVTLDHPCMGPSGYERNGFRLSDAESGYPRPSPLLGEHNEFVLGDILGLDGPERERLAAEGVIE